jgi:hypothetical protein
VILTDAPALITLINARDRLGGPAVRSFSAVAGRGHGRAKLIVTDITLRAGEAETGFRARLLLLKPACLET